jgi:pantetheine-phosphate adenylyltransferase
MAQKSAVFPGSFDPITMGHYSIILKATELFDQVWVALGTNTTKKYLYDRQVRLEALQACFESNPKINVQEFDGLTVDFCKQNGVDFIVRGLRNPGDFEFERNIAMINRELGHGIETVFLMSDADHSALSSTIVREIIRNGGDYKQFIPEAAHGLI